MKVFLIYILLVEFSVGGLIPKCDMGQLPKVKFILEHYELHKLEASNNCQSFSLFNFIYRHYISPDHHSHAEPFEHSELPFKTISGCLWFYGTAVTFLIIPKNQVNFSDLVSEFVNMKEQVCDNEVFIPPCI